MIAKHMNQPLSKALFFSHLADEIVAGEGVLVPHLELQLNTLLRRFHLEEGQVSGEIKRNEEAEVRSLALALALREVWKSWL